MPYRTLVVESQDVIGFGIREVCEKTEFIVAGVAKTLNSGQQYIDNQPFDLVIVAAVIGNGSGFEFCQRNQASLSTSIVLFISDNDSSTAQTIRAINSGAIGMIRSDSTKEQILKTMRTAILGNPTWTKQELRRHATQKSRIIFEQPDKILSDRENEVLLEVSRGRTNSETADALGIGYETVKDHVANILRKLEVNDRTQAAIWAVRNNVI